MRVCIITEKQQTWNCCDRAGNTSYQITKYETMTNSYEIMHNISQITTNNYEIMNYYYEIVNNSYEIMYDILIL